MPRGRRPNLERNRRIAELRALGLGYASLWMFLSARQVLALHNIGAIVVLFTALGCAVVLVLQPASARKTRRCLCAQKGIYARLPSCVVGTISSRAS